MRNPIMRGDLKPTNQKNRKMSKLRYAEHIKRYRYIYTQLLMVFHAKYIWYLRTHPASAVSFAKNPVKQVHP